MSSVERSEDYKLLLRGIDTVQCGYSLQRTGAEGIDYQVLEEQKTSIQRSKRKHPLPVSLGKCEFLLQPYGTRSGYPFVLSNQDFKIELGEFNRPNFFVTFSSQALWHESAYMLHGRFLEWAGSVGYKPLKPETLSRVDFAFDYHLPEVEFTEDWFVSRSNKDSQYREDGKIQTLTFGKGEVVLRMYDKVAEILQQSGKTWLYPLWGQKADVWRIEWQVRKNVLRRFDIRSFEELENQQGDLLRYLATEHDTLRVPNEKTNSSRDWPLHPLWLDLQEKVKEVNHIGIYRSFDEDANLDGRLMVMAVAMYGYLKRLAAVRCLQKGVPMVSHAQALDEMGNVLARIHDPLDWEIEVRRRAKEMELGKW